MAEVRDYLEHSLEDSTALLDAGSGEEVKKVKQVETDQTEE